MLITRFAFLVVLTAPHALCAQAGDAPPAGDPAVLRAFLRMHDVIVRGSAAGATAATPGGTASGAPVGAAARNTGAGVAAWQRRLGLTDADFAALSQRAAVYLAEQERVGEEASAYRRSMSAPGKTPDRARLDALNKQRDTLDAETLQSLKAELSPSGVQALFRFVDGEFRVAGHMVPIAPR